MVEAPLPSVFDAAQVRLAQLGQVLLEREAQGLSTEAAERAALDLRFGLETAAQLPEGADRDAVLGYLLETYGLLAVGADPFLRPLLPPIPDTGVTVRYKVRGANGRALGANTSFIAAGASLVPTPLIPAP